MYSLLFQIFILDLTENNIFLESLNNGGPTSEMKYVWYKLLKQLNHVYILL